MSAFLPAPSGPIHFKDSGDELPLMVAVHGLGGSMANWDAISPRLAARFHFVGIDLPGFGLSPPRADYSLDTHVQAVVEVIEHFGLPAVLLGNSLGGLVAELTAARHPHLVKALVLIAPATPPRLPDPRINWAMAARLAVNSLPGVGVAINRYYLATRSSRELINESLDRITAGRERVSLDVIDAFVQNAEARRSLPWATKAIPKTGRSIRKLFTRRSEFVAMIREIRAPTLVIQGIEDPIVSPTSVEWLCSLRTDWVLRQMSDTGHTPQIDAPVRTLSIIEPWLERHIESALSA